jgi:predicted LPLAT superfamily acyltransferase
VTPGSIEDADIAANAAIATSKLADGTEIAALVGLETELSALGNSDLVTAIGAPAAYSETPADIAAALVAAGLMQPSGA